VFEVFTLRALVAMIGFVAAGLAVGHVMGGPDPDRSIVLAIACAKRNPGIAIAIATELFPKEAFAPTIIMYALVVGALTTPYVRWMRRRIDTAPPPVATS
jgi:BASS family bile acid:Na+ symporter